MLHVFLQAALCEDVTPSTSATPQPQSHPSSALNSDTEETFLSSNLDDVIGKYDLMNITHNVLVRAEANS